MNFATWSIKKPVPVLMLFILLLGIGLYAFKKITVQDFPDIEFPTVTISATVPGMNPSQLEIEVTRKIEDSLASLDRIDHIQSSINEGASSTVVTFKLEKDLQEAVNEVRDAVSKVRGQLPADMNEPVVSKVTTAGNPFVTYAVSHPNMAEEELSWYIDNTVAKRLSAVSGVGKVTRQGGADREIRVDLDLGALTALGISPVQVSQQIKSNQLEISAGSLKEGGRDQSLRVMGKALTKEDLENMAFVSADGKRVRLGDIAKIEDKPAERTQGAYLDGKPVAGFQVTRAKGFGDLTVNTEVAKEVTRIEAETPNIQIKEVSTTIPRVQKGYDSSMFALYEGCILAVLVIFAFLRNWRATFIAAVALPLSIIPTFGVMHLLDFTLNTITFLALTLVVGVLVDDAIVEVENIIRHIREGKSSLEGAKEAVTEIGLAVIATSFTLIAVFLPTAFMGGIPGKFFKQFGWTAAIAVFMSLLVARLLTPMMGAYMLKAEVKPEKDGKMTAGYLKAVKWCLINPKTTFIGAGLFLVVSFMGASRIPATFMPPEDRGQATISLEFEPGTAFATMERRMTEIQRIVSKNPHVKSAYATIGSASSGGGPRGGGAGNAETRKATVIATLTDAKTRPKQTGVERELREALAGVPAVKTGFGMGASGEKMALTLAGDDSDLLQQTALQLERELRTISRLGNVTTSASLSKQEFQIQPDVLKMSEAGISVQALGSVLKMATDGDTDLSANKFNLADRQIPVRIRFSDEAKASTELLEQIRIPGKNGSTVPLGSIASIVQGEAPSQISRLDRQTIVSVSAELNGVPLGEAYSEASKLPTLSRLPAGITKKASGDLERMNELFGSFGFAMLVGVFCIYTVLVLLFHSFMHPVTILAALPLSAGGAFGLMAVTGHSFSMHTLIGLLMLMGIVTKNSILLVEYAITRMDKGVAMTEALLDACHKRARPIIMTTIAMIAGMMPLALGLGGNKASAMPMATAVIGGLITSTVLSLFVVPVIFELNQKFKDKLFGWRTQFNDKLASTQKQSQTPS